VLKSMGNDQFTYGIFFGLIVIMVFYHFFIYLSVKDNDYIYYIIFIFSVGLAQYSLLGYTFWFLWPDNSWLALQSTNIFIAISGITSVLFVKKFLNVKDYYQFMEIALNGLIGFYIICIIINITGHIILSQKIIQIETFIGTIFTILCGLMILKKGERSALFFNISWSFFLIGIIIYLF